MSTPSLPRYVGDSSVIVQSVIKGPNSPRVDTLLAGLVSQPPTWEIWLPDFYIVECANALWKEVKFHGLSQADAQGYLSQISSLALKVTPSSTLVSRALEIAMAEGATVYDSLYIALAERLNGELLTEDTKLAKKAQAAGIKFKPLTDFPPT